MQYVAYYRVSTKRQGDSGLGLDAQRSAVAIYIKQVSGSLLTSFTEVQSGKDDARPELDRALKRCRLTNATLLIAKLDRLSRNIAFLATMMEVGVPFVAIDQPHANELTIHILASVAQAERKMISERTRAALAVAKRRGVKLGNPNLPPGTKQTASHARTVMIANARARAEQMRELVDDARSLGHTTLQAIADHFNSLRLLTPRGCAYTRCSVRALIKLLA